uniref:Elongator complex protein 4 n=1 Tax=Heterorhabditis bacteriophora TaxID=37862 RepID=A0A1I7XD21_HETBA
MNFGDAVPIKGCWIKTRHLETSCGNSSIDTLLGGGIPNTSIMIVDETQSRVYAESLSKYFIAEGLYNDHDILVINPSLNEDPFTSIPSRVEESKREMLVNSRPSLFPESEDMKIAWRYSNTPQINSTISTKIRYDLAKPIINLDSFNSIRRQYPHDNSLSGCGYSNLYTYLYEILSSETYSKEINGSVKNKNLLRIVIKNIGSPLWLDPQNLSTFLVKLQSLIRSSYAVIMCTSCTTSLTSKLCRELDISSDIFIRLVAISSEEKKKLPSLDKFNGYFHLIRLPHLTSVSTFTPPAIDLVFELNRKSFDVKIHHLPPSLGDESALTTNVKPSCGVEF